MVQNSERIDLLDSYDLVLARQHARKLARELGFSLTDQTRIATAVSEVARWAIQELGSVSVCLSSAIDGDHRGLACIYRHGGHIKPTGELLVGGAEGMFSGVKRLMDDFELGTDNSQVIVVMHKWLRQGREAPSQQGLSL